jgi:MFS family permease
MNTTRLRAAPLRALNLLRENERLAMIMVTTALVMSGQGVVTPVLPLFASDFGASAAAVGLTLSIFALARLLLNVPLGLLADRRGRRILLAFGPLVTGLGMVGSGLAVGITDLLAWRFVAGAGSAMYMTGAQIYLADISTPATRARVMGANQAALLFGTSIGPAIGGALGELLGLRAPFFAVGFASLAASAYGYLRLPETGLHSRPAQHPGGGPTRGPSPALWLLGSRDFVAVSAVSASVFLTRAGGRMTLMPLLAASAFGYSAGELGAVFTAMALINLVGVAPAATIADRLGRKAAIVPSGLLVAAGLASMAAAPTQEAFLLAALLIALGTSVIGPAPAAYAADIAPEELRGLALGMYRTAGDLGFLLGPVLLGALADWSSLGVALLANAALATFTTLFFAFVAREAAGAAAR